MSQRNEILNYLLQGKALTPLEALNRFGCLRLGARIYELRRKGIVIRSDLIKVGNGKYVSQYSLSTYGDY